MTSRRSIAERVIARASARGAPVDADAEFMAIVELWVAGDIEADEMRDRYNALLAHRSRSKRNLGLTSDFSPEMSEATIVQASDEPADEATV
ncbi:hypothetical protein [Rhizobium sp. 007]|uniref:hypothetical protein n=1 Tax=Rhizobium sp. 007 TaxID=2785056 RepID=UPI00189054A1|nr:hypothetical protein [Rhizobium sp. 007]QPB24237.1 hypothetical protein ISN39_32135 [Rhizobium sp. 007]